MIEWFKQKFGKKAVPPASILSAPPRAQHKPPTQTSRGNQDSGFPRQRPNYPATPPYNSGPSYHPNVTNNYYQEMDNDSYQAPGPRMDLNDDPPAQTYSAPSSSYDDGGSTGSGSWGSSSGGSSNSYDSGSSSSDSGSSSSSDSGSSGGGDW
jgi:hypothetical protein